MICFTCYEKLITSYNFKKQCLESFNLLNKLHDTQIVEKCQKEDYIDQLANKSYKCDFDEINKVNKFDNFLFQ